MIEKAREFVASQVAAEPYTEDSNFNGLSPGSPGSKMESEAGGLGTSDGAGMPHRNILRKNPVSNSSAGDDESIKGRKRFSKRHSKNGLAAVF